MATSERSLDNASDMESFDIVNGVFSSTWRGVATILKCGEPCTRPPSAGTLSLLKPSHYRAQQRRGCAHRATVAHGETCMHGCSACTRTIHYSFFLPMHHDANSGHHHHYSVRAGRLSLIMASSNACCHLLQMVGTHQQRLTSTWH